MRDCSTEPFSVNGRKYRPPRRPVAAICLDGAADAYLDCALARGRMPLLRRMTAHGYRGTARAALPSFTNVNNASIITGAPPSVHGISGNYFLNPQTGEEVMMNSAAYLRAPTIVAAAAQAGRRVAVVTAKDKLRDILAHELKGIAFSAENGVAQLPAGRARALGIANGPAPEIYSAEASLFVLRAGVALIEEELADFLYLSLTDYVQHKYGPEEKEALDFMAGIDLELGRLLEAGALVAMTADHGMNAKQTADGAPNVIYLQTLLDAEFGPGCRVVLPITDPYVLHHGALGSFASVYLRGGLPEVEVAARLMVTPGITEVYSRKLAALKLELPPDRIGDLVVMSGRSVALGRTPQDHDLSAVASGLRSHGGRYEEMVPFILSEPLLAERKTEAQGDVRNFDLFDDLLNGTAA
ncbi:MAG TPA: phosphonoacetate hydrolase [Chthonomonadales bacterium]|nr:phosphonoacetate hydrolase [Chthonomonadales bacterium]